MIKDKGKGMKLLSLNCPNCHATIDADEGQTVLFCKYCGNKILLDDEAQKIEYTYIDKGRIVESENEKQIRLLELQMKIEQERHERKITGVVLGVSIIILLAVALLYWTKIISGTASLIVVGGIIYVLMFLFLYRMRNEKSSSDRFFEGLFDAIKNRK